MAQNLKVFDCIGEKRSEVRSGPFTIGSSAACDLRLDAASGASEWAWITRNGDGYRVVASHESLPNIFLDGELVTSEIIDTEGEHTLVINGYPIALYLGGQEGDKWLRSLNAKEWWIYQSGYKEWEGPIQAWEISLITGGASGYITLCSGMSKMGFHAQHVAERLAESGGADAIFNEEPSEMVIEPEVSGIDMEYGEFTCPVCWLKFDRGDLMNIAVHASFRGDPILGEEHMQRFLASRFNDRGQALDAMGVPSPELACPHCRRKLPQGFTEEPHYIFSIVGAPTSGKSYYLSVLIKVLQNVLFREFGTSFRDASPSENAVLNDMKRHLFGAVSPQDAYLAKTDLEGALYERLPRQGRQVMLPKPFVFRVSDDKRPDQGFSTVFYDNAGEHFEPGRNSADSPGAQHIAVASGVLFLFDPLFNSEFRARLNGVADPQLEKQQPDQQDVILSEVEARIKELLGMASHEKISTPISVLVGKSDAWLHLLGDEPLLDVIDKSGGESAVNLEHIKRNSARIRELLMEICPAIVSNVEAISTEVSFFAVSSLGHAPVKFVDSDGVERIGPDPVKLKPERVEDPILWMLSRLSPNSFPSTSR
ncbi:MAG: hypothetical protein ACJAVK_003571 [Akkermansiaceae bacterium]|jgi:hypothetical protein